jgi:hypothetical protein
MRHALITIHLLNRARDGAIAQAELAVEEPAGGPGRGAQARSTAAGQRSPVRRAGRSQRGAR